MSKQNNAAKHIEKITPAVGMYLMYTTTTGNRPKVPLKVTYVDGASIKGMRRGARRTSTIDNATLDQFRLATPEEIAANPVNDGEYEAVDAAVSTEAPRPESETSKANDEEPKSEPPTAPQATEANALVKPLMDFLQKQRDDELAEIKKRLDREEQARREDIKAIHATVETLAKIVASKQAELPAKSATSAEREAKAEKDRALTEEHKKLFKDLLDEFVNSELERIDPVTKEGSQRALSSGKVLGMFEVWLVENNRSNVKPYSHAIYSLLRSYARGKHKVESPDGLALTVFALKNKRQTALNFANGELDRARQIDAEASEIVAFARAHLWPNHGDAYAVTVTAHLDSGKFTKDDILLALERIRHGISGSKSVYTPVTVFSTESLKELVRLARKDAQRSAREAK